MNRYAVTICALLPLVVGVFHWRATAEQRAFQMLRMQDTYRMAKPMAISTAIGNRSGDALRDPVYAAHGFLLESLSLSEDVKRAATIHSSVSLMPWKRGETLDTSRPSWASKVTWRVTGTIVYPNQRNLSKNVFIGWETEMRCDAERKNWKLARLTTRPFGEDLPPRILATAVGQQVTSVPYR